MPDTLPTLSYDEALAKIVEGEQEIESLQRQLRIARDDHDQAREDRNEAIKTGNEWRDMANERKTLVENQRSESKALTIEAAELRGYIRRVNELDPKRVRQQQVRHVGPSERDIERMMRR